jgi:hypothetical protein
MLSLAATLAVGTVGEFAAKSECSWLLYQFIAV